MCVCVVCLLNFLFWLSLSFVCSVVTLYGYCALCALVCWCIVERQTHMFNEYVCEWMRTVSLLYAQCELHTSFPFDRCARQDRFSTLFHFFSTFLDLVNFIPSVTYSTSVQIRCVLCPVLFLFILRIRLVSMVFILWINVRCEFFEVEWKFLWCFKHRN